MTRSVEFAARDSWAPNCLVERVEEATLAGRETGEGVAARFVRDRRGRSVGQSGAHRVEGEHGHAGASLEIRPPAPALVG